MDLINLKNSDKAMKQTQFLSIVFALIILAAVVVISFILSSKIDDAYTKSYIFDSKGGVYLTSTVETKEMRVYEYENHVKTFYTKWYSFDEETYSGNIKEALELIGEKGKELLNEYNDLNMHNTLIQKNIRYGVIIKDVKVDVSTIPVSGYIKGVQTGYRAKGSISRNVDVRFTLYDTDARSRQNVHGCKIDQWIVSYSAINDDENETEGEN